MSKKKKIIASYIIFIILVILLFVYLYIKYNEEPNVDLKENLTVSLNDKVTNLSFVDNVEKAIIETKEKELDTSKLGIVTVKLLLKNKYGKKSEFSFNVEVIDNEKPVISFKKNLETTAGTKIDLLKNVTVTDNWDKDLKVTIKGDYDFNKVGEYKLYYVATDSSKNETLEEFTLKVKAKPVVTTVSNKTFTTSNGHSGVIKNGITYIDGILIANKTYSLPSNYGSGLTSATTNAFNEMKKAAKEENLSIKIVSGYRSYSTQKTLYNNYVKRDGKKEADTYSARPGHSEHQTGLAFDINNASAVFDKTKEASWLYNNCYKYGFILRYPKGKENITGYIYESWHFRYVGKDLASKLYNNGDWITLEEYFGITSKYSE